MKRYNDKSQRLLLKEYTGDSILQKSVFVKLKKMKMKMMVMMKKKTKKMMMMILCRSFSEECLPDCTPGLSIMGRARVKGDHLTASPALKCFNFVFTETHFLDSEQLNIARIENAVTLVF